MRILVACEQSGRVWEAFRKRGHAAWSCDLLPSDHPQHIQMDVNFVIGHAAQYCGADRWDLIICHPPCTALSVSGNGTYAAGKQKHNERIEAVRWTNALWNWARHHANKVCFENPVGVLSRSLMGKPTQYIQPWQFGHPETKMTGLWLSGLPSLEETNNVKSALDCLPAKEKHKVWHMSPGPERAAMRSLTYQGIADAMADQRG